MSNSNLCYICLSDWLLLDLWCSSWARRAKPFIDHILTFSLLDGKIWFRNFQVGNLYLKYIGSERLQRHQQILEKDPLQPNGPTETSLVEIVPRFVLTPIRFFEGAFSGATIFSNPGMSPQFNILIILIINLLSKNRICLPCCCPFNYQKRERRQVPYPKRGGCRTSWPQGGQKKRRGRSGC